MTTLTPPRPAGARTVDDLLAEARSRIVRVDPQRPPPAWPPARCWSTSGPPRSGRGEGEVPGALIVERNVLEWRFDPASDHGCPRRPATTSR